MKALIASSLLTLGLIPAGVVAQQPAPTPRDSAFHALNRLAYGPRPGDVPRVAAEGVMRWIDRQLSPHGIDDHRLAERERQFQILGYDRGDLAAMYTAAERERRERKLAAAPDTMADKDAASPIEQRGRRPASAPGLSPAVDRTCSARCATLPDRTRCAAAPSSACRKGSTKTMPGSCSSSTPSA